MAINSGPEGVHIHFYFLLNVHLFALAPVSSNYEISFVQQAWTWQIPNHLSLAFLFVKIWTGMVYVYAIRGIIGVQLENKVDNQPAWPSLVCYWKKMTYFLRARHIMLDFLIGIIKEKEQQTVQLSNNNNFITGFSVRFTKVVVNFIVKTAIVS